MVKMIISWGRYWFPELRGKRSAPENRMRTHIESFQCSTWNSSGLRKCLLNLGNLQQEIVKCMALERCHSRHPGECKDGHWASAWEDGD